MSFFKPFLLSSAMLLVVFYGWDYSKIDFDILIYMISYEDFEKVDMRVGRIVTVEDFPEARKPAYKLTIDFGKEIGIKRSSVQITQNYSKEELLNTFVLGVVNFPPKQIGPFISECLTLGVDDENGNVVLVMPDKDAVIGSRLY